MLAVYAIVNGDQAADIPRRSGRWASQPRSSGAVPSRSSRAWTGRSCRFGLFRLRNLATANVIGILWAASMFAWFFLSALYMQLVLGYTRSRSDWRSCPPT